MNLVTGDAVHMELKLNATFKMLWSEPVKKLKNAVKTQKHRNRKAGVNIAYGLNGRDCASQKHEVTKSSPLTATMKRIPCIVFWSSITFSATCDPRSATKNATCCSAQVGLVHVAAVRTVSAAPVASRNSFPPRRDCTQRKTRSDTTDCRWNSVILITTQAFIIPSIQVAYSGLTSDALP